MTNPALAPSVEAERLVDLEDADLLVRVRRRQPDAFRVLYERHREAVSRYAHQCARSTAEAEDYVAETFARVLQQLQEGRGPSTTFRAYAFTVVRNLAADRGRRSAREEVVADLPEGTDQRDEMAVSIERDHVRRAFEKLPPRWRRVLWLSEVEGCKPAEMASALGMNATAAAALAYRVREGLRQAYLLVHLGPGTPARCRRTVDKLPAYVRAALPASSTERVRAHLADCAFCRARYAEITELDRNLRGLILPLLLGGAAVSPMGMGFAGLAEAFSRQWTRLRNLLRNPAAATTAGGGIAVAVAAAATLTAWLTSRPSPDDATAAAIGGRPPASPSTPPSTAPPKAQSKPPPGGPPRSPADTMVSLMHDPARMLLPELAGYPAHLHIDLLPGYQRQGHGRTLMHSFLDALKRKQVRSVHLGMVTANTAARAFYDRLGFHEIPVRAPGPLTYLGRSTD